MSPLATDRRWPTGPEIGLHVEARNDLHGDACAIVEDTVQVDFNHELAGRTLVFDVRVLDTE